ncbi:MAG: S-adenosylmethionine decarboxylase proenzyme [Thermotoga sp.]|nr:S-adenosylmethionine decarboxylase proenzyme [Thermotogota bacterium]RKX53807.1 MAG: S-adenosylmethionine decarboxylase proenzyme [Thermotoga sp.]
MKALGRHLLVEFYDCDKEKLNDLESIKLVMLEAARKANATVVESVFHRFKPYGISGVVVIAESHLTIHTWPEYGYSAVDLFTCGEEVDPWKSFNYLHNALNAGRQTTMEIKRGKYEDIGISENSPYKFNSKLRVSV